MNLFIFIMLIMTFIGLLDKILNNRFQLCDAFDNGLKSMGNIAVSMVGFYCIAITFIQNNTDIVTSLSNTLPIDPSIFIGCLLAPDMGGYTIVQGLSNHPEMIIFSGILLTSTIGATISFQLPIFLTSLPKKEIQPFINGLLYGILSLPLILIITALFLPVDHMWINLFPILLLCIILSIALSISYDKTIHCLHIFANIIRIISIVFFGMVILQLFFNQLSFTTITLISEAMVIVLRMCIIVCGSMVLCDIILRKFRLQINKLATILKINDIAVIGLILSLGTSIAMIPLFPKMDTKGKIMNAAFSVSGAYVLGGQLGFISSVATPYTTNIYIIVKLAAGLLAIGCVLFLHKENNK